MQNLNNTMENKDLLTRAVKLAEEGIKNGSGPFGAIVVLNGEVISEAVNLVVHTNDATAHAEIVAIRQAGKLLRTHNLSGCVLYSSCEPCPMCLGAIYWSGIKTVYFAADRKDAADAGFSDKYIYDELSLSPERRHIRFNRIKEVNGVEVFRIWNLSENKIPY
jgi:guanine deaminase